ncbi:hypothetical protein Ancab_002249 [Ancistrocladus abbreviatus]
MAEQAPGNTNRSDLYRRRKAAELELFIGFDGSGLKLDFFFSIWEGNGKVKKFSDSERIVGRVTEAASSSHSVQAS